MAFQVDAQARRAGPAREGQRQGGEQRLVDAVVVGRRQALEEVRGLLGAELKETVASSPTRPPFRSPSQCGSRPAGRARRPRPSAPEVQLGAVSACGAACPARRLRPLRKEVVLAGRRGAARARPGGRRPPGLRRRTRQETPSTTRWWATRAAARLGRRTVEQARREERPGGEVEARLERRGRLQGARRRAAGRAGEIAPGGRADRRRRGAFDLPPAVRRWAGEAHAAARRGGRGARPGRVSSAAGSRARAASRSSAWLKWWGSAKLLGEEPALDRGERHLARRPVPCSASGGRGLGDRAHGTASPATVGCSKSCRMVKSEARAGGPGRRSGCSRIESPPSSKKLSSTPTCGRRSTCAQTAPASPRRGCAAPRRPARGPACSEPLRRRQRLPVDLAVGGQRQRRERRRSAAGTMESGSRSRRSAARSSSESSASPTTRRRPGACRRASSRTDHRLARLRVAASSAASISPSSMRNAADLHLVVDAAEELEAPSAQPPAPGRRCGRRARRARPQAGRARSARAVRSGPPR